MSDSIEDLNSAGLPTHVAVIMDGNGRWASRRGRSRIEGHAAGARAVEKLIRYVGEELSLGYLTLFAFSTENWDRPQEEVEALMVLLQRFALEKMAEMRDAGIRLRVAGDVSQLPSATKEAVLHVMDETRDGDRLQLTIALNYGSQQEIVYACRELALDVAAGKIRPEDIDRDSLRSHLYTAEIPDPDLVIRTSGEMRLSNFLLWQSAYAELAFSQTLWPDFTPEEFVEILREYQTRSRRFGAVGEG